LRVISRDENFQDSWDHPIDHKRNEEVLEELKVEPVTETPRRYKSNWPRYVTRMKNNRMTKIMLNCRPNGRRQLGRPLDEAEICPLRPNS